MFHDLLFPLHDCGWVEGRRERELTARAGGMTKRIGAGRSGLTGVHTREEKGRTNRRRKEPLPRSSALNLSAEC